MSSSKAAHKEPIAMLWIIVGMLTATGLMILIERLVQPRW
jgi:hypothetical protein